MLLFEPEESTVAISADFVAVSKSNVCTKCTNLSSVNELDMLLDAGGSEAGAELKVFTISATTADGNG